MAFGDTDDVVEDKTKNQLNKKPQVAKERTDWAYRINAKEFILMT